MYLLDYERQLRILDSIIFMHGSHKLASQPRSLADLAFRFTFNYRTDRTILRQVLVSLLRPMSERSVELI